MKTVEATFHFYFIDNETGKEERQTVTMQMNSTLTAEELCNYFKTSYVQKQMDITPVKAISCTPCVPNFQFVDEKKKVSEKHGNATIDEIDNPTPSEVGIPWYTYVFVVKYAKQVGHGCNRIFTIKVEMTNDDTYPPINEVIHKANLELRKQNPDEDVENCQLISVQDYVKMYRGQFVSRLVWCLTSSLTNPQECFWIPAWTKVNGDLESVLGTLVDPDSPNDIREFTDCPYINYEVKVKDTTPQSGKA